MKNNILEIKHLKKYYGSTKGIEDISFELEKGCIYGFIGPNGAGKSTTIRCIMGLINSSSGDIYIKGKKIGNDDVWVKEIIGYVPGEINLYKDMYVKEIFDYHESFYNKDLSKRRKELVKLLKVDENKRIWSLSLGNLKKIGIILALMHEPEILILDEPTSGLDPIMQNVFHEILLEEKNKGTTILYSSHILSEVSSICDRIGFIKDGVIIKEDFTSNIKMDNYTYLRIVSNDIEKIKKEIGLTVYKERENEVFFINNLEPNILIKKLSKFDIKHMLIEEIPLEDLFMNYYK